MTSPPTPVRDPRAGVVFLVHCSSGGSAPNGFAWSGYWDAWSPPDLLDEGAWATATEAIAWARARCDVIIVRVDMPPRLFSAGALVPKNESLAEWPPADVDRFDP
jgi:hypothetical protein